MSDNKYTVVFKAAKAGADYINKDGELSNSTAGHMWYVLYKNDEFVRSAGFQSIEGKPGTPIAASGEITGVDEKSYKEFLTPVTIQINQKQFDILNKFGNPGENGKGANAKSMGFDPTHYNVLRHNCVTYVYKALNLIGYNPDNINPATWRSDYVEKNNIKFDPIFGTFIYKYLESVETIPSLALAPLIHLLAKHGAIAVDDDKLIPVSELKNISSSKIDNEITGYDDNADEILGGQGKDTLIGKSGNDTLNGGTSNDTLKGGNGFDTYRVDEGDIIIDSDGKGEVYFNSPTIQANIQRHLNDDEVDEEEYTDYRERYGHGITDEVAKGKLTYAILESYMPGGSSASFAFGQGEGSGGFSEDFPFFYMPYRYEVQGLQLPAQRPKSSLVDFTAESLIVTPINPRGESVGESITIKNFRNGDLGIHLLDIVSYRYSYFGGKESFYSQKPNDDVVYYPEDDWVYPDDEADSSENHVDPGKTDFDLVPDGSIIFPKEKTFLRPSNIYMPNDIRSIQLPGIRFSEADFRLKGNDLFIFYQGNPLATLQGFYNSPHNNLQNFHFSDRTLSLEQMRKEGFTLSAYSNGGAMYDWHKSSNTTFNGAEKDDKIYAGDGDDTLVGGKGNDLLQGGNGADKYVFKKGHGQDIITEFNTTKDEDSIQFNDVKFEEVKFRRDNYDLTLFGYNEQDSVTIKAFFADQANQLENYQFSDRTFTLEQFKQAAIPFVGTEKNDQLYDWQNGEGSATFDGGKGNDILNGNTGADTYLFGKNHGDDIINENTLKDSQDIDIIKFTEINHLNKLRFSRKGNHLRIQEINTDDSVTVNNWFTGKNYQVEQIQLADNSVITNSDVNRMIQAISSFGAQNAGGIVNLVQEEAKNYIPQLATAV